MINRYQLTYKELDICRALVFLSWDQLSKTDQKTSQKLNPLGDKICQMLDSDLDFEYHSEEIKLIKLSYELVLERFNASEISSLLGYEKKEVEALKNEIFRKLGSC